MEMRMGWVVAGMLGLGAAGCEYVGHDELRVEQMGLGMNSSHRIGVDMSAMPAGWIEMEERRQEGVFASSHRIKLKQGIPVVVVIRPWTPADAGLGAGR